ncbi:ParB N-terminal domain-containing protein [Siminovitchia sp. 179-K 8D1 HS]|uniref:ParB N-terminal domain-containing protein n=1 Tax=Siminovitchia sp. 179-K 8D1 HS TaxID=3142385 RepID=UPI0039A1965F
MNLITYIYILKPLVVTKGFRVIDGKHRLKAAKELNIESVRVIIEEISEDKIPAYITATKLNRDDLKSGQKAALVVRLFYEEERMKAKENQGTRTDITPDLGQGFGGKSATAKALAEKAGIGRSSMEYLIAVFKKRPDLFERVFKGIYADEQPDTSEYFPETSGEAP